MHSDVSVHLVWPLRFSFNDYVLMHHLEDGIYIQVLQLWYLLELFMLPYMALSHIACSKSYVPYGNCS
jgi:hypothetical protein